MYFLFGRLQTTKLDIGKFCNLKQLTELKVRSPNGLSLQPFSFSGGLQGLSELKHVKSLVKKFNNFLVPMYIGISTLFSS